jgi:hypothetical protein
MIEKAQPIALLLARVGDRGDRDESAGGVALVLGPLFCTG